MFVVDADHQAGVLHRVDDQVGAGKTEEILRTTFSWHALDESELVELDQTFAKCILRQSGDGADIEFVHDALAMRFNRFDADVQV